MEVFSTSCKRYSHIILFFVILSAYFNMLSTFRFPYTATFMNKSYSIHLRWSKIRRIHVLLAYKNMIFTIKKTKQSQPAELWLVVNSRALSTEPPRTKSSNLKVCIEARGYVPQSNQFQFHQKKINDFVILRYCLWGGQRVGVNQLVFEPLAFVGFDIWLHLLNLWLQQHCLFLQPWSPYWPLERLIFGP